ncbi:cysteine proteinase [Suhomyces tanzawaensis NRRL Y-17324]|uniref:Cysteine protease RIM13 n=1 Tax=Suhomyces tanzawaensis NRRL Y-17324 TaxID=984487 RepID=A0A1E4SH00_9ASCO|nr:cysteine proteinase [Suhomyces tanzawaensis NRRL Y-17324]ODV78755.1 cysteine proteinase [Suhomyces tanzawaensis NRRL Y-17324]
MSLSEAVGLLQQSHVSNALDNPTKAKKECLQAMKILNGLAQDLQNVAMSRATMKYYDILATKKPETTEKMLWLNSKIYDFHYPVLEFSESLDSGHFPVPSFTETDPSITMIPPSIEARFEAVSITNWSQSKSVSDLYQDVLTNCSFVSSLLSLVDLGYPLLDLVSPKGPSDQYRVRLHFNGTQRLVTVDNQLPFFTDRRERHLTVSSSSDTSLLWPALIEKAHLKIMGNGYRFEGSNMANDTYLLSGYIPEIISLHNSLPANFAELWNLRNQGQLTLGIGTGKLSKTLSAQLNLTSNHDYSIEAYKAGSLVIKNSWVENQNLEKRFIEVSDYNHFKYLYVNWKPSAKFKYLAKRMMLFSPSKLLYEHTQPALINPTDKPQKVWALLERSLPNKHEDQLIMVSIYNSNRDKLFTPTQYRSVPNDHVTNNRIKLETFTMEPRQAYTMVVTSNYPCYFTLTLYHNISPDFNCKIARFPFLDHLLKVDGEWNTNNSGGNWSLSTFMKNPQFSLVVKQDTHLLMGLFASNDAPTLVGFHLFHSEDHNYDYPLRDFDKTKLIFSESYTPGFQTHKLHLKKGYYKLILSTYERVVHQNYRLVFNPEAATAISVEKIHNTLGLFLEKSYFDWNGSNRYKMKFSTHDFNVAVTFQLMHLNGHGGEEVLSSYRPGVRGSVFSADGRAIKINQEWNDSLHGVFVDATLDMPGNYILLVERLELGAGRCNVEVGSSKKLIIEKD